MKNELYEKQMKQICVIYICRCAFPQKLPGDGEDDPEAAVPRVRAHLPPALPAGCAARRGGPSQHLFQALYILRAGGPLLITTIL